MDQWEEFRPALLALGLEEPPGPGEVLSVWEERKSDTAARMENAGSKPERLEHRDHLRRLESIEPELRRLDARLCAEVALSRFRGSLGNEKEHLAAHHFHEASRYATESGDRALAAAVDEARAEFHDRFGVVPDAVEPPPEEAPVRPAAPPDLQSDPEPPPASAESMAPGPPEVRPPEPPRCDGFLLEGPNGSLCRVLALETCVFGRWREPPTPGVDVFVRGVVAGDADASELMTAKISKRHFTLRRRVDGILLEDGAWNEEGRLVRSSNGLWVDGEPVVSLDLARTGSIVFRITVDALGPSWRVHVPGRSPPPPSFAGSHALYGPGALFLERLDGHPEHILFVWSGADLAAVSPEILPEIVLHRFGDGFIVRRGGDFQPVQRGSAWSGWRVVDFY